MNTGSKTGDFKGGWGFGSVRQATWDMYEEGDTRREGSINKWEASQYTARFQDTHLFMAKYAARVGYNPQGDVDLNYCNNFRIFRFSETLLNYAEMVVVHGQSVVDGITVNPVWTAFANVHLEWTNRYLLPWPTSSWNVAVNLWVKVSVSGILYAGETHLY